MYQIENTTFKQNRMVTGSQMQDSSPLICPLASAIDLVSPVISLFGKYEHRTLSFQSQTISLYRHSAHRKRWTGKSMKLTQIVSKYPCCKKSCGSNRAKACLLFCRHTINRFIEQLLRTSLSSDYSPLFSLPYMECV